MYFLNKQKKALERLIVEKVVEALEKNSLSHTQLPQIGKFVLRSLKIAKSKADLDVILEDLYKKWPGLKEVGSPKLDISFQKGNLKQLFNVSRAKFA